jgi:hypothetical protein
MSRPVDLLLSLALIAPLPSVAAAGDVQLTLQGKPALTGDYKPADVTDLTMRNGQLAITFGSDGSATSLIKNGQELVHNLNGIAPRDPDRHRTWYIDYSGRRRTTGRRHDSRSQVHPGNGSHYGDR